jgi:outer membrane lipoprotein-sorting protein
MKMRSKSDQVIFTVMFLLVIATVLLPFHQARPAEEEIAKAIVEKADRIRFPQGGYQVHVRITTSSAGRDPDVREYEILGKGNERSIVRTLAPATDKGQVLLMRDRDLWLYMPSLSQPIRLSAAQKLTGQVANGDLARANFSGDYTPTIIRTDTIENETYHVLELKAVDRSVTYNRVVYWVNKSNNWPHKAEFYAVSGKLLKTCHYQNFKEIGGAVRPTTLVMVDALSEGGKSVLDYSKLQQRELPDRYFTKDYLTRLQ